MQSSIRFDVQVPADHVIKLPDHVPVGPAEVIVVPGPRDDRGLRSERARQLVAACPPQSSDSVDLVREDRSR
jgi:hypothetical protein